MTSALDLLMDSDSTAETTTLLESNGICTIDSRTRTIFVPPEIVVGAVQSDKNAERIKFSCPKIVGDNLDLSKFSIRINFENVSSVDPDISIKDQYICEDASINEDNITFSWVIGKNAARYMGTIRFIVCAVKTDSDSNISIEWNTTVAQIPVLEGIEVDQPSLDENNKDIINQLLAITKTASDEAVKNVNSAKEQAITDIQNISQPDKTLTVEGGIADAKATGNAISSLREDISTKITKFYASSQGNTNLQDSDNGKIQDMMLYGKSSQDGTPTPENPVEIKSVMNPTVKVCGENLYPGSDLIGLTKTYTTDFIPVILHKGKIYFSFDTSSDTSDGRYHINAKYFDINKELMGSNGKESISGNNISHVSFEFNGTKAGINYETIDLKNASYVKIMFGIYATTATEITYKNIMISATDSDFEPYKPIQTVTLPYTLNAIPVESGGNVTIDGQQYIADYVDVERGKVVKRVKVLNISNLDKSKWGFRTDTSEAIGHSTRYYGTSSMLDFDTNINAMSNIAIYGGIGHDVQGTFRLVDAATYLYQFNLDKTKFDKVQDFTDYLASNNVYIQYALKVPQELDLKPEEIVLFKSLSANYPVTNIFINSEQLDGYTVFNYPISMQNGWNYVKQQIGDTRDYIYDMDLQSAEAYVNSEYAVALTELEV